MSGESNTQPRPVQPANVNNRSGSNPTSQSNATNSANHGNNNRSVWNQTCGGNKSTNYNNLLSLKNTTVDDLTSITEAMFWSSVDAARMLLASGLYDIIYVGLSPTMDELVKIISKLLFLQRHHEWTVKPCLVDPSPAVQMLSLCSSLIIVFTFSGVRAVASQLIFIQSGALAIFSKIFSIGCIYVSLVVSWDVVLWHTPSNAISFSR